jgi:hypothetical protein
MEDFLENNPKSDIREDKDSYTVVNPWNDETIILEVDKDEKKVINRLSNVHLPPKFTAIYHKDENRVEFIYGPISADSNEKGREFSFYFEGREFYCQYAGASEVLDDILSSFSVVKNPSSTNHRNLTSISEIMEMRQENKEFWEEEEFELVSFYVDGIRIDEDDLENIARHLNFYMNYFDRSSPEIVIHEDKEEDMEHADLNLPETFPEKISARKIDEQLLRIWESAKKAPGSYREYLYSYQVIEYASHYFLKDEIRDKVKKILMSPDILNKPEESASEIANVVREEDINDVVKINKVIEENVSSEHIWKFIEPRIEYFSSSTHFEGGYTAPSIVKEQWGISDFEKSWMPKYGHEIRKIRNALVHAKEGKGEGMISPTDYNTSLLRPWATMITETSRQMIAYHDEL